MLNFARPGRGPRSLRPDQGSTVCGDSTTRRTSQDRQHDHAAGQREHDFARRSARQPEARAEQKREDDDTGPIIEDRFTRDHTFESAGRTCADFRMPTATIESVDEIIGPKIKTG